MKVHELLEELSRAPMDSTVVIFNPEGDSLVEVVECKALGSEPYFPADSEQEIEGPVVVLSFPA